MLRTQEHPSHLDLTLHSPIHDVKQVYFSLWYDEQLKHFAAWWGFVSLFCRYLKLLGSRIVPWVEEDGRCLWDGTSESAGISEAEKGERQLFIMAGHFMLTWKEKKSYRSLFISLLQYFLSAWLDCHSELPAETVGKMGEQEKALGSLATRWQVWKTWTSSYSDPYKSNRISVG